MEWHFGYLRLRLNITFSNRQTHLPLWHWCELKIYPCLSSKSVNQAFNNKPMYREFFFSGLFWHLVFGFKKRTFIMSHRGVKNSHACLKSCMHSQLQTLHFLGNHCITKYSKKGCKFIVALWLCSVTHHMSFCNPRVWV